MSSGCSRRMLGGRQTEANIMISIRVEQHLLFLADIPRRSLDFGQVIDGEEEVFVRLHCERLQ